MESPRERGGKLSSHKKRSGSRDDLDSQDLQKHPASSICRSFYRLKVFIFGILIGLFVIRPFLASEAVSILPAELEAHPKHQYDPKHNSRHGNLILSKKNYLQRSANATDKKRQQNPKDEESQKPLDSAVDDGDDEETVVNALQKPELSRTNEELKVEKPKKEKRKDEGTGLLSNTTVLSNVSASTSPRDIVDFERQPGVVIATKIHGPPHMKQLIQSMCLLKVAYNRRPKYDVLVYVTEPISALDESILRDVVRPANLQMVLDRKTLRDHLDDMSTKQMASLMKRCNATSSDELFWWTRCCEDGMNGSCMPLAYNWQSEFRSLHSWKSEELKPYKYMLWFDSDAFPTKMWDVDPVVFLIRNDLKILFDNFPQGKSSGKELREKIDAAYNETLCFIRLKDGHLEGKYGGCSHSQIPNIHGFFHITDLDFYRNKENLNWSRIMIGDNKFSRRWDDQLAVTIPAAIRAANKSWDMNANNITLEVYHNQFYDGRHKTKGGFQEWWKLNSEERFPEGRESCQKWIRNGG